MARGRFVSKTISLDAKVHQLSCPMAQLLWTWMIPHLDVEGRMYGDPVIVRSIVFPRRSDVSIEDVDDYLDEMHALGLVVRYEVGGEKYLQCPNFAKHQVGLRRSREPASVIPPNPATTESDSAIDAGRLPEDCRKWSAEPCP